MRIVEGDVRHRRPRLLACDLTDANRLSRKIDQVLRADVRVRRSTRRLRVLQERLREVASEGAFDAYLRVEEAANERGTAALDVIAAWAFRSGGARNRRRRL